MSVAKWEANQNSERSQITTWTHVMDDGTKVIDGKDSREIEGRLLRPDKFPGGFFGQSLRG
jgi:hypothetical protein